MPEGPPYFQLIEGELFMSPSPNFFHQKIIGRLHLSLGNFLEKHPFGEIVLSPADVELDEDNVYQPDLYYLSHARLSLVNRHGLKGAPDFVIEVISGSTGRLDRGPKKAAFARHGVREFWAVLPESREVVIWNLPVSAEEPSRRLQMGDTLTTELLPAWEMPVAKIFGE